MLLCSFDLIYHVYHLPAGKQSFWFEQVILQIEDETFTYPNPVEFRNWIDE